MRGNLHGDQAVVHVMVGLCKGRPYLVALGALLSCVQHALRCFHGAWHQASTFPPAPGSGCRRSSQVDVETTETSDQNCIDRRATRQ